MSLEQHEDDAEMLFGWSIPLNSGMEKQELDTAQCETAKDNKMI